MALSELAKQRVTKLIRFMESLPKSAEDHFSMGTWFRHAGRHKHSLDKAGTINSKTIKSCGTTACAAGWAATIPEFKKAGFTYSTTFGFSIEPHVFFNLNATQESALFFNFKVLTPKEWAAMAREKLRKWSRK